MSNNENQVAQISESPNDAADDAVANATDEPIDVACMPVNVCFEAGRILTRYEDLCRIRAGYTYELGHTLAEHSIDITANGALIARGELVNVGDQLGVRITALGRSLRSAD